MDFRVNWTQAALNDLHSLVRYISRDNGGVATRFGNLILSKVDSLFKFPRIGRVVPEFTLEELRQIIVPPYRIIYEIDDRAMTISVVRVWHGARADLDKSDLDPGN
jgi:toxin ParE1/3/4